MLSFLWSQPRVGARLALALLPRELVFWIGFALPFAVVLGLVRTAIGLVALSPLVDHPGS